MKTNLNQAQIKKIIRAYEKQGYAVSITVRSDGSVEFTPIHKLIRIASGTAAQPLF